MKEYRASVAGHALGKAIIEMVHLMYQKRTARKFLSGLLSELHKSKSYFTQE